MSETVLREVVLPAAFNRNGSKFIDCEFDKKYEAQDNFQSSVFFVSATVDSGKHFTVPLVVKFQPKDDVVRKELNTSVQFYNEICMYSELLPFINKVDICQESFPTFYYGIGTLEDPEKDVILIEDLRPKGFRLTNQKAFIDLRHLELAMEKLGRFHALSYIAKKENPTEFYRLVGKLKEPTWIDSSSDGWMDTAIRKCFHRAMDPLISAGRHTELLRRLLARVDDTCGVVRLTQELVAAEEPMAVLCHGDFCRNNMLFSYGADGVTPVDVRFFDVATARYSSPAVDIAFFLLLNSSAALRADHYDQLLSRYHAALSSAVTTLSHDVTVPSLQQLQQEMRLKAVYGFVHVSFFLPMMLWGNPLDKEGMEEITPEEVGNMNASLGGEEGTKLLMDMVEELIEKGCLTLGHPFFKKVE